IGDPGTGKSMLARSMTEMLPREDLQDIIVYHNPEDPNEPKIRVVPAGKGREIVNAQKAEAMQRREQKASMVMTIVFFIIGLSVILSYNWGAQAREREGCGGIPKASKGVLFVEEIAVLSFKSQESLLTVMQERKFSIVGQSERTSGSMVKTEAVPRDFILVAAGNLDAVQGMHPALRSRIRGYGYEIYMKSTMPDTEENRLKLVRFVAQEVSKDRKIPHFDRTAVLEILREAQRRAGRRGQLTLRL